MTLTAESRQSSTAPAFYIDGECVEPRSTQTHRASEAAIGDLLGTAALGTGADIDAAVRAGRRALDEGPWGRTTATERAAVMRRFADALRSRAEGTSALVSRERDADQLSGAFNGTARPRC